MKIFLFLFLISNIYSKGIVLNSDKDLNKYCTKCHFVYQADFLPKRSWELLFTTKSLNNHFGERVVLSDNVKKRFLDYYLNNASDVSKSKIAKKVNRSIEDRLTPLRVSRTEYIKDKHKDLGEDMVTKNKDVKSPANCVACHGEDAKKGKYIEDNVKIPHYKKGFFGWSKVK